MTIVKQRTQPETKFAYENKYRGRQEKFSPKANELVATFDSADAGEQIFRRSIDSAAARVSAANPDRRFAVLEVAPSADVQSVSSSLLQQEGIANVIPAMLDQNGATRYFLPDEFTVQFKPEVSPDEALQVVTKLGSQVVVKQRTPGYLTVSVPGGMGLFEAIDKFSNDAHVHFAEPSEFGLDDKCVMGVNGAGAQQPGSLPRARAKRPASPPAAIERSARGGPGGDELPNDSTSYFPGDPEFGNLWGLHNTGQTVNGVTGSADCDIDAPEAWDFTRGRTDVIIAVIDTGCDLDHPDLRSNILPRNGEDWDFADIADGSPDDTDIHGTHVAGTCVAIDNVTGVIGTAPRCRVMPLRVNLTSGMNQNRADAIQYVAAQAVAHPERRYVINCSWRMNGDHAGVHNAIVAAVNSNVVVCFAAGNEDSDIDGAPQRFPAVYPEVIAVAATDQRDVRASFSNFGAKVDVCAPGVNIFSTIPDDTYTYLDGTSMASPHAAATAALIWSRNKQLTNQQVRSLLETTADNIDAKNPAFAGRLGKGRINALAAMRATPPPRIQFTQLPALPVPQLNAGSSTALHYVQRFRLGGMLRAVLMFLTQRAGSERVYYLNPGNGAVLGSVDPVGNDTIGSVEWDGTRLQVSNVTVGSGFINAIHPTTGAQLGSLPVPPGRGEALAIVGGDYFYSTISRIHRIRRATGAVLSSFVPPGGSCHGLAFGDGLMFSANATTGWITAFDPFSLIVKGTLLAPDGAAANVHALAYDAKANRLYVGNQNNNRIDVLELQL